MSEEKQLSIGAKYYLLMKLREHVQGGYYNYYDGFQELTQELVRFGYAHMWEALDDERAGITLAGYLLIRDAGLLYQHEIEYLNVTFKGAVE